MRSALLLALVLAALLAPQAKADDPLICVVTGAVYVDGVIYYDPPDPCVL